jgi:hypothetical protein
MSKPALKKELFKLTKDQLIEQILDLYEKYVIDNYLNEISNNK